MSSYNCREIFGKNVKKFREERKLSLKELSKISGITKNYLERIEEGSAQRLILKHIEIFSKVFGVESIELFKK